MAVAKRTRLAGMLKAIMSRQEFAELFREAGRRGGLIGGRRAADKMTPEERRARASKAARARWAGRPKPRSRARPDD